MLALTAQSAKTGAVLLFFFIFQVAFGCYKISLFLSSLMTIIHDTSAHRHVHIAGNYAETPSLFITTLTVQNTDISFARLLALHFVLEVPLHPKPVNSATPDSTSVLDSSSIAF